MTDRILTCLFNLLLAGALLAAVSCSADQHAETVRFTDIEVVDGDSVRIGDRSIRLLGYDTPERDAPWFEGNQDPWASLATETLEQVLRSADRITLRTTREPDKYGRELAQLYADGVPVGVALLERGLAYETVSRYGDNGFTEEAEALLHAARKGPEPAFMDPHRWRDLHSKD